MTPRSESTNRYMARRTVQQGKSSGSQSEDGAAGVILTSNEALG
jgi:hypothetical protein